MKLVDFGLAKATSQIETTDPGVVKGKFSYLSPEAASGEEVDRARRHLRGRHPPVGDAHRASACSTATPTTRRSSWCAQAQVPSIAPQNPEVEPELEEIVRKALAADRRIATRRAADLQDALAQYLFSRGLKVIQRDIGDLVRGCLEDMATLSGTRKPKPNIIDTILHEEIDSFTSLEYDEPPKRGKSGDVMTGRRPHRPAGLGRGRRLAGPSHRQPAHHPDRQQPPPQPARSRWPRRPVALLPRPRPGWRGAPRRRACRRRPRRPRRERLARWHPGAGSACRRARAAAPPVRRWPPTAGLARGCSSAC